MKHSVKIVFGEDQIEKLDSGIPLSKTEEKINVKKYTFKTETELTAFLKGIDEAIGWMEYDTID